MTTSKSFLLSGRATPTLLAAREFKVRASELLGIRERGVAFDFDCAAALWMKYRLPTAEELILKGLAGTNAEE